MCIRDSCEGDTLSLDKCCRVAVVRENEEDVPHLRALAPKGVYTTARPYGECVSYMPVSYTHLLNFSLSSSIIVSLILLFPPLYLQFSPRRQAEIKILSLFIITSKLKIRSVTTSYLKYN